MSKVKQICRGFAEACCMYRYPVSLAPPLAPPVVEGLTWQMLNFESTKKIFAAEPRHKKAFCRFLAGGSLGMCISVGSEWAAHAWMSVPGRARPPHIMAGVAPDSYWIYYCATKYGFGGKGLYKFAQRILLTAAFQGDSKASVLIDTTPHNLLSRRAILSTGFQPAGMIFCKYLWLPRLYRLPLYCSWNRHSSHPLLPERSRG